MGFRKIVMLSTKVVSLFFQILAFALLLDCTILPPPLPSERYFLPFSFMEYNNLIYVTVQIYRSDISLLLHNKLLISHKHLFFIALLKQLNFYRLCQRPIVYNKRRKSLKASRLTIPQLSNFNISSFSNASVTGQCFPHVYSPQTYHNT